MIKQICSTTYKNINKQQYIFSFIIAIFISLSSEVLSRSTFDTAINWILYSPLYFILSVLFIWAFITLLSTLLNGHRVGSTFAVFFIFILSMLSRMKYDLRGLPLMPIDIYLFNEALNIKNVVNLINYKYHIMFILISTICTWVVHKKFIQKQSKSINEKVFNLLISILIIASLVYIVPTDSDYSTQGLVINFTFESRALSSPNGLSDYNSDLLEDFLDKDNNDQSDVKHENKPNIIVIMNEAFWDSSLLKDSEITPNPLETFESLKQQSIHGVMEVPVYAGGTVNTEFEVMTGYSTHYFNEGYMLYPQEVKFPFMSLASVLKNQDYKTVGIHPFWGWYYNRNEVYKHLGFDDFITEEYLSELHRRGYYISDEVVTTTIIDQLEQNDDPSFIYAVTMQNHGPYDDDRYKDMALDVEVTGDLDDVGKKILQTYAQGLYDADRALNTLVEYLEQSDEPTILLFFGDHLPLLGENYKLYKDLGHLTGEESTFESHLKIKTTPFIIWSNFSDTTKDLEIIDAIYLGPYLLNEAKVDIPMYYKNLLQLYSEFPVINSQFAIDSKGNYISKSEDSYNVFNDKLKALQYDIMYGAKLTEERYNEWIVSNNSTFNSKINDIEISKVYLDSNNLVIEGKNLYPKGRLFINELELEYDHNSTHKIIVENFLSKSNTMSLEVSFKLIDTIEKVLAEAKINVNLR